ncbi:MAG: polysaccharide deacetylase family protein [Clostridia bacterium]|nr:polysaccharide deacetylase family protein [Clostridia bacterium]
MKAKLSFSKMSVIAVGLAVLITGNFLVFYNIDQNKREASEKTEQCIAFIKDASYKEAKDSFEDIKNNFSGKVKDESIGKVIELLQDEVEAVSNLILKGKPDMKTEAKVKSLNHFKEELTEIAKAEFQRIANLYGRGDIDYKKALAYFGESKRIGFFGENVKAFEDKAEKIFNARKDIELAHKLFERKAYFDALEKYEKIIKEDEKSFRESQERIRECKKIMLPFYLKEAENMVKGYNYQDACGILEKLITHYPDDPALSQKKSEYEDLKKRNGDLVKYNGPIQHIFFHPLIAFPELAFDNDYMTRGYNQWMITVKEFNKILDSLYRRNFILIDIREIVERKMENGKYIYTTKELMLPKGKKPLVISIDDLNYYEYMVSNGNVHKLIVDSKGDIATYSVTPKGEKLISYENEIVPILDAFVKKYPDFSFRGAKGIIALTGYEGILGYRTHELNSPKYESEKKDAIPVVKRLKETGWSFASHGYGHLNSREISYERFVRDTNRWKKEVETLIGPTELYIYPFGASVDPGDKKFQFLMDSGFGVFCGVSNASPYSITKNYVIQDRRNIDGLVMHYRPESLWDLYDVKDVIDPIRPNKY